MRFPSQRRAYRADANGVEIPRARLISDDAWLELPTMPRSSRKLVLLEDVGSYP